MKNTENVDISNLHDGDIVKNYREMCKLLNEPIEKGTSGKKAQIAHWERFFSFEKSKQKFIIIKVYDTPMPKNLFNRKNKYCHDNEHRFMDDCRADKDKCGVYKITYDNYIYVGSTIASFLKRLNEHIQNKNYICYDMLFNHNAKMYVLEDMTGKTEKEIRDREYDYIKYYKNNKDWICTNKRKYTYLYKEKQNKTKNKNKQMLSKEITVRIQRDDIQQAIKIMNENNINYKIDRRVKL